MGGDRRIVEVIQYESILAEQEMTRNIEKTISKIKNGILTIGSWIQIADTSIAKIMSSCEFDWIVVDLEHGKYSSKELPSIFDIIRANNCLSFARLAGNSDILVKEALDAGAGGIIVPMVNNSEDARNAVAAAKYPPEGIRGIGFSNASNYGKDFERYFDSWNRNVVVIVQIEHIDGVNNLQEILVVEGVDGFIVGPYDLSGSMNITGDFGQPSFIKTMGKITETGRSSNKLMGIHVVMPDTKATLDKIKEGYNFIAYSIDSVVLWYSFTEALKKLENYRRGEILS